MTYEEYLEYIAEEEEANRFDCTPHFDTTGTPASQSSEPGCLFDSYPSEPPAGSWAATARLMAKSDPDFDWDAWKDEMKESA